MLLVRFKYLPSFLLFLALLLGKSYGQGTRPLVDVSSEFSDLKTQVNDTLKVEKLIGLYKTSIRQGAIRNDILDEALRISKSIFYINGIAKCFNRLGIAARNDQDYIQSVTYHKRALGYFEKSTDTLSKIKCLNSIGVSYRKLNMENEAYNSYLQALQLSEAIGNDKSIAIALSGIGNILLDTHEYDQALPAFMRALGIEKKNNNLRGQEYAYANIGEVYLNNERYDSARVYFNKALKLAIENPRKEGVALIYNFLGLLSQKEGDYIKSTLYYEKAIPMLRKFKNIRYLGNTQINIGINKTHTKEYKQALASINLGLRNALKIHSRENITLGYSALVEYYTQTNNYKEALLAYKNATKFHDSIVNVASRKNMIAAQMQYESAKKDTKIKKLAEENELSLQEARKRSITLWVGAIVSALIIAFLLLFINLLHKNRALVLEGKNIELKKYMERINELRAQVKNRSVEDENEWISNMGQFDLSIREIDVLRLISKGYNNDEIAEELFVSKNTVKTHIQHIYTKLDVKNRIQAMKKVATA
ncbi:MAG: hypothetical protein CR994_00455 [Maribacter sp.]|nr:MAG: hypothetical protein CR994_00455 [Maribacter sp.]